MSDKIDKMVSRMIDIALKNPDAMKSRILVISMSKKTLEKILTPGRMDLMRTINEKNPKTIGQLSKLSRRPLESVSRDLRILENYGLLELVRFGKEKQPKIDKDILMIPLTT